MERTYRKIAVLGLAIVAVSVFGRVAIADWLIENTTFSDDWPITIARLVYDGWAIVAAVLITLGSAYLGWSAARNTSKAGSGAGG